jgi:exopolysaccharide biosynthesis predicted pyruvyltransferase EpsI
MHLAVFGDVHGNLGDMYRYAQRWNRFIELAQSAAQ